jgi:RNA polymerase sigma factor (sigma-70 family)
LIAPFLAGDVQAADRLARLLDQRARAAAAAMLGREHRDLEDVIQDTVIAVLDHIDRRRGFEGDLHAFTVTAARNRCRSTLAWHGRRPQCEFESAAKWLAQPDASPLDLVLEAELLEVLQTALDNLDPACHDLLRAFYLEGVTIEEIRRRVGLRTVQGVYYRRRVCLDRIHGFLNNFLFGRSSSDLREDDPGDR